MKPELKPCPFCGAKAKLHHEGRAYCRDCGIENMFLTVDKWNSRPIEDTIQAQADKMKVAYDIFNTMTEILSFKKPDA